MKRDHFGLLTLLAASLLLIGAKQPPSTAAEKDAAMKTYYRCLMTVMGEIDDGTSDAYTVGSAAANRCTAVRHQLAAVWTQGSDQTQARMFEKGLDRQANDEASGIALQLRSMKRRQAITPKN